MFPKEGKEGRDLDHMAALVGHELEVFRGLEDLVDRPDSGKGLASKGNGEPGGAFLQAVLAHQGARGGKGIDVRELHQFPQSGKLPAAAVILLQLIHAGEEAGAHGGCDALVHRRQPHGHLATEGVAGASYACGIDLPAGDQEVDTAYEIPEAFAHHGTPLLANAVLADSGGDGDVALFGEEGGETAVPVAGVPCSAVPCDGNHRGAGSRHHLWDGEY